VLIRLTEEEYTLLAAAADAADEALANWSRGQLLRAAARANPAPSDESR
jgi:hypothetical protein